MAHSRGTVNQDRATRQGQYTMNTMQDFITAADTLRVEGKQFSQSNGDTPAGFVRCFRDYGVYRNGRPSVARTTWKLNEKTVSAAKLAAALNGGAA